MTIKTKKLKPVARTSIRMGADPEFFIKRNKRLVGAETIIPEKGLEARHGSGSVIIDGVQAELNPQPSNCREILMNNIRYGFISLKESMEKDKGNFDIDVSQSVEISKTELARLNKENQKLGCAPSKNVKEEEKVKAVARLKEIDPLMHRQRAAGGHMHFSFNSTDRLGKTPPETLVTLLDIICGNTCVLVDHGKGNKERRKLYGKAGEFRTPSYGHGKGIEYRTPSNFWLQSPKLMSLTFGMARLAFEVAAMGEEYYQTFIDAVDLDDIQNAINNNDFDLAYSNFKKIQPLIEQATMRSYGWHPLRKENMKDFLYFVYKGKTKGMSYWFKKDPLTAWTNDFNITNAGFSNFLNHTVREEREGVLLNVKRNVSTFFSRRLRKAKRSVEVTPMKQAA